ncbi:MAG: putative HicB family RNase H-like nuclease [Colwellia sp.]|jgi:predicted HicB family RNase H-like nuclease
MQRVIKNSLCVLFSSLLLSACSFSFIYNNLDWWSNWYLDDYVKLTQEQQQVFDTTFDEIHSWHRQTQLKEYYLQLTLLKGQVNGGITKNDLKAHLANIREHWFVLREKAKPQLISLIDTLSKSQRQQVIDEIENVNNERIEDRDEITKEEWYKETCQERQKEFKKWVGKLSKDQKAKICNFVKEYSSTFTHRMEYRIKWHSDFKQALIMDITKPQYEVMLTELISNPESLKSNEYISLSEKNSEILVKMFHYVLNNLTVKQRNRFNNEIDDYIDDFRALEMDY